MQFDSPLHAIATAIRAIFERWTALTLTVEHQCGGAPEKAIHILDVTVQMATDPSVRFNQQNFIDFFYSQFDSMNTDIEDGSPEQVAAHIVRIRDAAAKNNFAPAIDAIQQSGGPTAIFGHNVDGSRNHMDPSNPQQNAHMPAPSSNSTQPIVDEDGFTQVRRSGRDRHPPERLAM